LWDQYSDQNLLLFFVAYEFLQAYPIPLGLFFVQPKDGELTIKNRLEKKTQSLKNEFDLAKAFAKLYWGFKNFLHPLL
tara:strand:+ start:40 stop:273 length:234 start_codon:yes stop_codon:yes gene_type:complete